MAGVLLIEDEADLREAFSGIIETEGFSVTRASDGVEAFELLATGLRPCLIILDLMMPRMDGVEFRRRQRADPMLADIPVVVVSGVTDKIERVRQLGVVECLRKPPNLDRLVALVAEHCSKHS
jgi:two-component system response regulator MprA